MVQDGVDRIKCFFSDKLIGNHNRAHRLTFLGLGALLLLAWLFASLAESISERESLVSFDNQAEVWLLAQMTPALAGVFNVITILGSGLFIGIISGAIFLALAWKKEWRPALILAVAAGGGGILDLVLKAVFHRPRPDFINVWVHPADFSFPSGHAYLSIIFYSFVVLFLTRRLALRWQRVLTVSAGGLLVLAIGLSRLLLGAHFPSDVLAGWAAGGAWLIATLLFFMTRGAFFDQK